MNGASRTRIGLFVLFHALYALTSSGNAFRIPDEFEVYFQTEHLIDAGDLSVPQALAMRQAVVVDGKLVTESIFFGKIGVDGKPYAPYGPLAAVLAVPHHLAGRALAGMLGIPRVPREQGLAWVILVGGVTALATATAGALAVAGFHRAAMALGTPAGPALWLSLILGGATVLWPYATSFFSEAWLAAAMIWAAAFLIEARHAERPRARLVMACGLLVVMGLTKVNSLIVAPAFVAAALADGSLRRERRMQIAAALAAAIAVGGALQLGWNAYRFGSPFEVGYDWAETIPVMPARAFSLMEMPRGVAVLLFAPGKSLFLWAPITVLALLNFGELWRRDRAVAVGLASGLGLGLLAYGSYLFPEGGYSHGPRHLVPMVPLLALAVAGPAASALPRAALLACTGVGLVMAVLATRVSYLEDQALRRDAAGRPVPGYYEIVDPAPGRANNRYRFEHIPFVTAMSTPGWSDSPALGQGPDYFYRHLSQARRQLRDGPSIPAWLPTAWPAFWLAAFLAAAAGLWRQQRLTGG
jgi:hypothetical protein